MKFVLDTNVFIAAFITSGICHEILEHVIRNHKIVLSDFIVTEFKDKLLNKFQYTEKEADEALKFLRVQKWSKSPHFKHAFLPIPMMIIFLPLRPLPNAIA